MTDMHFTLEAKPLNSKALPSTFAARRVLNTTATDVRSTAGDVRLRDAVWRRAMAILLLIVLFCLPIAVLKNSSGAASDGAEPMEVVSYTVAPGDTLWSYAERVTPEGGDVSETVEELKQLNHLQTSSLQVGQRIVVPIR